MTELAARAHSVRHKRKQIEEAIRPSSDITVGKDILELLSTAMYVNPLTIFREYVQNSADAIDDAYIQGELAEPRQGRIVVRVLPTDRKLVIRDNGIGLSSDLFEHRLLAFGASHKRGMDARGFRGVGRLAGLGYCQSLVFRSRASRDRRPMELRWDCRKLMSILLDPRFDGDLSDVVRQIVWVSQLDPTDYPARFFEVELDRVVRIKNDLLLNTDEIGRYLSQVAPAPFSPDFRLGQAIHSTLNGTLPDSNFLIFLDGDENPLFRPFRDEIRLPNGSGLQFTDVDFIEAEGVDSGTSAVGWVLHHDYRGAIQGRSEIKGLRARVGDIQVGSHNLFEEIFPEQRFNSWTVGEIHVLDRRITPNGRRDHFEQNQHFSNLLNQLLPLGRDLARRCRTSSMARNRIKLFEIEEQKANQHLDIIEQGALPFDAFQSAAKKLGTSFGEMAKAARSDLLFPDTQGDLDERLDTLKSRFRKVAERSEDTQTTLDRLPPAKRDVYEEVIGLIYECSVNRVAAKALVDRILARVALL